MAQPEGAPTAESLGFVPLGEALGVPSAVMERPEFVQHLMLAVSISACEQEVALNHPRFPDGDAALQEQFGERWYHDGTLGAGVKEVAEDKNSSLQPVAERFVTLSAEALAIWAMRGRVILPIGPTVFVDGGAGQLGFEGGKHAYRLPHKPQMVVDYGPGFQGRFHTDRQLQDLQQAGITYGYVGLARGPFIPAFLRQHLALRAERYPTEARALVGNRLQAIGKDGIENGVERLAESMRTRTGSSEFADIVIASGIHSAGEAAITGVAKAFELLKSGGVLLVRAPKEPPANDPGVPIGELRSAALGAGFRAGRMRSFDTTTRGRGDTRHESQVVIFRK